MRVDVDNMTAALKRIRLASLSGGEEEAVYFNGNVLEVTWNAFVRCSIELHYMFNL